MKDKTIRHKLHSVSPLTDGEREELKALAARPDSETDTSEVRILSEEQWKQAVRGKFYRPLKQQITARLDADVLDWLKQQGRGYQSRMNDILRREMLMSLKASK